MCWVRVLSDTTGTESNPANLAIRRRRHGPGIPQRSVADRHARGCQRCPCRDTRSGSPRQGSPPLRGAGPGGAHSVPLPEQEGQARRRGLWSVRRGFQKCSRVASVPSASALRARPVAGEEITDCRRQDVAVRRIAVVAVGIQAQLYRRHSHPGHEIDADLGWHRLVAQAMKHQCR
jgi:hypothetical protein